MRSTAMPALADHRACRLAGRHHARVERRRVEAVERQIDGLHLIVAEIGDHAAERRGDAGEARITSAAQARSA